MTKVGRAYRENLVQHLKGGLGESKSAFLISYKGVSGAKMNSLRKELKSKGAQVHASRNSLSAVALKDLKFEKLIERLAGQTAFIWSDADSVEIAKSLVKFAKENQGILVLGGVLEGGILEKDDVDRLSQLPSRGVLLSMLLSVLQSPLSRLAGVLNAKTQELLSLLIQLSEKKGGTKDV